MKGETIYLDNAATTPMDERVTSVMAESFRQMHGNASSLHHTGTQSREAIDRSRNLLASTLGTSPETLFFTSGGTESNNWALKGLAHAHRDRGRHLIVSSIEHDCILKTCEWLEGNGFSVTYLPVDETGTMDIAALDKAITPQTLLVSVMHANNEIGTIEPVPEIGALCRSRQILFHTDACQSYGKIPLNVDAVNADLVTINAHKIYGPKGIGALYLRRGVRITPLLHGGGQEAGLRSTTENTPAIVGFAKAAEICHKEMNSECVRLEKLRKRIETTLRSTCPGVYFHGHSERRLPGHLSFSFSGLEGETIRLLFLLDEQGIAVSAGSACSNNETAGHVSHVLTAIGLNAFEARGAIRVSLGRFTTDKHVDTFLTALQQVIGQLNPIFS